MDSQTDPCVVIDCAHDHLEDVTAITESATTLPGAIQRFGEAGCLVGFLTFLSLVHFPHVKYGLAAILGHCSII
jgi:hypothetical protein